VKVICIARCPIGGHFATGSDDGVGRVWSDPEDDVVFHSSTPFRPPIKRPWTSTKSTLLSTLPGHLNSITDIAYSHQGDRILTASQKDGVVRIWSWGKEYTPWDGNYGRVTHISTPIQILIRLNAVPRGGNVSSTNSNISHRTGGRKGRLSTSTTRNTASSGGLVCDVAAWTCNDFNIVTSQSNLLKANSTEIIPQSQLLRVWDSHNGRCLLTICTKHTAPCPVLIPHPYDSSLVFTGGADGRFYGWDLHSATSFMSHENKLYHGAIVDENKRGKSCAYLDGGFSPDGLNLVLTDDTGRIILMDVYSDVIEVKRHREKSVQVTSGTGSTTTLNVGLAALHSLRSKPDVPHWMYEQYFASDYYELSYDTHGYAMDTRSHLPPHLAPRASVCNHTGTSYGEGINLALVKMVGPRPLAELDCMNARDVIHERAMEIRGKHGKFNGVLQRNVSGKKGNVTVAQAHGGVFVSCYSTPSKTPSNNPNGGRNTSINHSRNNRSGVRSNAQLSNSGRYNYLGFEDNVDTESEGEDEDYVEPVAPAGVLNSEEESIDEHLDEDGFVSDVPSSESDTNSLRQSRSGRNRNTGRSLGGRHRTDQLLTQPSRRVQRDRRNRMQRRERIRQSQEEQQSHQEQRERAFHTSRRAQASRVSSRQSSRGSRRVYTEEGSGSELDEYISSNRRPAAEHDFNGHYVEDVNRGHFWKLPAGLEVKRKWLRRDESKTGRIGLKSYVPQVGDSVVYIPRAHYDTIHKFPTYISGSAPWKSFPTHSAWPVVRCKIIDIRYRFPIGSSFRFDNQDHVVAIVTLEVNGIPKINNLGGGFPWPVVEFIQQRTRQQTFEVSLFQSGEADFIVPASLYLWRQKELENAIKANNGNPTGLKLTVFYAPDEKRNNLDHGRGNNEELVEDAPYDHHCCEILSIDGINIHDDGHVTYSALPDQDEFHFQQSGYNSLTVKFSDGSQYEISPWEVNLEGAEVPPPTPILSHDIHVHLLEEIVPLQGDEEVKNWFLKSVDNSKYTDYEQLIEVPIHLDMITTRLRNDYYVTLVSFLMDFKLLLDNCGKYNEEDSKIFGAARSLYDSINEVVDGAMDLIRRQNSGGLSDAAAAAAYSEDMAALERQRSRRQVHATSNGASVGATSQLENLPGQQDENGLNRRALEAPLRSSRNVRSNATASVESLGMAGQTSDESASEEESHSSSDEQSHPRNDPREIVSCASARSTRDRGTKKTYTELSSDIDMRSEVEDEEENSELDDETAPQEITPVVNVWDDENEEEEELQETTIRQYAKADDPDENDASSASQEEEEDEDEDEDEDDDNDEVEEEKVTRSRNRDLSSDDAYSESEEDEEPKTTRASRSRKAASFDTDDGENDSESYHEENNVTRSSMARSSSNRLPKKKNYGDSGSDYSSEECATDDEEEAQTVRRKRNAGQHKYADVTDEDSYVCSYDEDMESDDSGDYAPAKKRKRKAPARGHNRKKAKPTQVDESAWPEIQDWCNIKPKSSMIKVAKAVMRIMGELDEQDMFSNPVITVFPTIKTDYLKKVPNPMDFKTIGRKIRTCYKQTKDFQRDLILVFSNCCQYNGNNSKYGKYAISIWQKLTDAFHTACIEEGIELGSDL